MTIIDYLIVYKSAILKNKEPKNTMQIITRFILKLFGWTIAGALPPLKKYIIIVAPHTSNWDLVICLFARFAVGVKINFLAKSQLFVFPLGQLLRALGGTSVERGKPGNKVDYVVALFREKDELKLGLAPEGTRSQVKRWKEGFYHIAVQAGIPIVMVGLDYHSKELRINEPFNPSGDIHKDFANIVQFYRTIRGRYAKDIPDYSARDDEE